MKAAMASRLRVERFMWDLGGGGFDKIENPILRFVGFRRPVSEDGDGTFDVVPIDVPLIRSEPAGCRFNVGDFDGGA